MALASAAMVPILGLGVFAYLTAARAVEAGLAAINRAAAAGTAQFVRQDFEHWRYLLESFAELPAFSLHVRDRNVEGARARLRLLVERSARLDRAFVTSPEGELWSDYPPAPESIGLRFAERDWYRGVSREGRSYVSAVYTRHAHPAVPLVAMATPMHDPETGDISGFLVAQLRLPDLTRAIERLEVGEGGYLIVLDHHGVVAAHPRLDLEARQYDDYASLAERLPELIVTHYDDPVSGEPMVGSMVSASVGGQSWRVIAQQPTVLARAPIVALGWRIGGAGVLVLLLTGVLVLLLVRDHLRSLRLLGELDALSTRLAAEVAIRQRAEQDLQAANARLEQRVEVGERNLADAEERLRHAQKMEAVGQLAGGVAHDFNNLLTVIIGYAELAEAQSEKDATLHAAIAEIRAAGERAAALTRQLLAFSRKQVLQPEVLFVNAVVERMDRMLRRLIGENIDLVTRLRPDCGKILTDPGQLEQIIVNLVVNARDAMPEGGKLTIETGRAELDAAYADSHPGVEPGPYAYIAISDTGVGMDAATRERVFEPFFTTKGLGRGTGLGLSTVYGIVRQSGGAIWVYSEPGSGTTFRIYLPEVVAGDVAPTAQAAAAVPGGNETLLVVEDEAGVRSLIRDVLTGGGYRVLLAENAEQAVALFDQHGTEITLLLTDVVLPGVGGPELARKLRQRAPGLEVLYMSGYTDDAIVHRGVLDAGVDFIGKPLRADDLLRRVRAMLDRATGDT